MSNKLFGTRAALFALPMMALGWTLVFAIKRGYTEELEALLYASFLFAGLTYFCLAATCATACYDCCRQLLGRLEKAWAARTAKVSVIWYANIAAGAAILLVAIYLVAYQVDWLEFFELRTMRDNVLLILLATLLGSVGVAVGAGTSNMLSIRLSQTDE
ncbi:MAG: hypothetical protein WC518_02445 [Patescibacteria group bacterium]